MMDFSTIRFSYRGIEDTVSVRCCKVGEMSYVERKSDEIVFHVDRSLWERILSSGAVTITPGGLIADMVEIPTTSPFDVVWPMLRAISAHAPLAITLAISDRFSLEGDTPSEATLSLPSNQVVSMLATYPALAESGTPLFNVGRLSEFLDAEHMAGTAVLDDFADVECAVAVAAFVDNLSSTR